jgi:hypothetical protein
MVKRCACMAVKTRNQNCRKHAIRSTCCWWWSDLLECGWARRSPGSASMLVEAQRPIFVQIMHALILLCFCLLHWCTNNKIFPVTDSKIDPTWIAYVIGIVSKKHYIQQYWLGHLIWWRKVDESTSCMQPSPRPLRSTEYIHMHTHAWHALGKSHHMGHLNDDLVLRPHPAGCRDQK